MARLDQGLLGGYSGKLGTTVGASWKGINVVRTYQPNVANPNTPKQSTHRSLFKDWIQLASFILPDFVKPLWDGKAKRMSGYNAFVQANLRNDNMVNFVDPAEMILSQGMMGVTPFIGVGISASGELSLEWDNSLLPLYGSDDDVLFAILFNYEGELLYKIPEGVSRSAGVWQSPSGVLGGYTEGVLVSAWRSADGKFQSNTDNHSF